MVPNLGNKTKGIVHYKNLQLYLSLGIKLTKIHKVLKFKQSGWIHKYIDFNTEKGINAANSFQKDFFKLMTNSVRLVNRLVNNEKDFLKDTSRPTHITHKIFDKNYAAILEIKSVLTLKKTIYVGFTVLELSNWLMYDFHYNFTKNHFDAAFLFTDTDSVTHEIKSEDVYEELFNHKHLLDFSNFSKESKFYGNQNESCKQGNSD